MEVMVYRRKKVLDILIYELNFSILAHRYESPITRHLGISRLNTKDFPKCPPTGTCFALALLTPTCLLTLTCETLVSETKERHLGSKEEGLAPQSIFPARQVRESSLTRKGHRRKRGGLRVAFFWAGSS
jgi:hypothetical protein